MSYHRGQKTSPYYYAELMISIVHTVVGLTRLGLVSLGLVGLIDLFLPFARGFKKHAVPSK